MRTTPMLCVLAMIFLAAIACGNREDAAQPGGSEEAVVMTAPSVGLHEAALTGDAGTVRLHIEAGTDLDAKDPYGSTPLIVAVTFGRTEAAKALIDGEADVNEPNAEGSTPLHIAAFLCRTDIVEALLAAGADADTKNNAGRTALQTVEGSFEDAKPIYDGIARDLGPLGLKLDYEHIRAARPLVAELLKGKS